MKIIALILNHLENILKFNLDVINIVCTIALLINQNTSPAKTLTGADKIMFYLFTQKGTTDRFFCGNIYEGEPSDEIKYHGCPMTFHDCINEGLCKEFATRKEANRCSNNEEVYMHESNEYAEREMYRAERYGCEGVDCD